MSIYRQIRHFLTTHWWTYYAVLLGLLFGACFHISFVYLTTAYVILLGCFLPLPALLPLMIFLYPFETLLRVDTNLTTHAGILVVLYKIGLTASAWLQHLSRIHHRQAQLNWPLLSLFAGLALYIILPPHAITLAYLVKHTAELALIYVVYQERHQFNYGTFTKAYCTALCIAAFVIFLRPCSARLMSLIVDYHTESGYRRIIGILKDVTPALALLCIARYYHQIDLGSFCLYGSILTFFCLQIVSRDIFISLVLIYLIFVICYAVKYRRAALKPLAIFGGCLAVVCLASLQPLSELLFRMNLFYHDLNHADEALSTLDMANLEQILAGTVYYDPGRIGLWKLYWHDLTSSPLVFLFGRGLARPWIGMMLPHNTVLYLLWQYGLLGCGLIIAIIFVALKPQQWRWSNLKHYYPLLIMLIPAGFTLLINVPDLLMSNFYYVLWILTIQFIVVATNSTASPKSSAIPASTTHTPEK